jgi:complement component 1 Q subcomponent-binding protein
MLSMFRKALPVARNSARLINFQNRCFFSEINKIEKELARVLETEIQSEVEDVERDSYVTSFLEDNKWDMETSLDSTKIVLKKKVGDTTVKVFAHAKAPQAVPEEENAEENGQEESNYTEFFILVDKNGPSKILLDAFAMEGELTINGILVSPKAEAIAESKDVSPYNYTGPSFETLDENLQNKITKYVKQLGLDDEFARFIEASSVNHESKLYKQFLTDFKNFVGK